MKPSLTLHSFEVCCYNHCLKIILITLWNFIINIQKSNEVKNSTIQINSVIITITKGINQLL